MEISDLLDLFVQAEQNIYAIRAELRDIREEQKKTNQQLERLINGRKYPDSKPVKYTEEWL